MVVATNIANSRIEIQSYQSGRISLVNSEQALQTALDSFKFQLGLPARVPVELDEAFLIPFKFNSPELVKLQEDAEALEQWTV